jgi:hypothetical protein
MIFFAVVTIVFCFSLGVILMMFGDEIGKKTFFELIPGFGITNFIEKFILRRKLKDPNEKPGMFVYIWFIRIFGGIWILFSFCMIFIVFFSG